MEMTAVVSPSASSPFHSPLPAFLAGHEGLWTSLDLTQQSSVRTLCHGISKLPQEQQAFFSQAGLTSILQKRKKFSTETQAELLKLANLFAEKKISWDLIGLIPAFEHIDESQLPSLLRLLQVTTSKLSPSNFIALVPDWRRAILNASAAVIEYLAGTQIEFQAFIKCFGALNTENFTFIMSFFPAIVSLIRHSEWKISLKESCDFIRECQGEPQIRDLFLKNLPLKIISTHPVQILKDLRVIFAFLKRPKIAMAMKTLKPRSSSVDLTGSRPAHHHRIFRSAPMEAAQTVGEQPVTTSFTDLPKMLSDKSESISKLMNAKIFTLKALLMYPTHVLQKILSHQCVDLLIEFASYGLSIAKMNEQELMHLLHALEANPCLLRASAAFYKQQDLHQLFKVVLEIRVKDLAQIPERAIAIFAGACKLLEMRPHQLLHSLFGENFNITWSDIEKFLSTLQTIETLSARKEAFNKELHRIESRFQPRQCAVAASRQEAVQSTHDVEDERVFEFDEEQAGSPAPTNT